jgi:hypothetical protein
MTIMNDEMNDDAEFTDEQLAFLKADADEAERGYSLEFLRTRRRLPGRPLTIGSEPAVMVRLRMAPDQLRLVDARAARLNVNRSQYIRDLVSKDLAHAAS